MELYRLTKEKYQMLYTAGSCSLALVESLAHLVTVRNLEPYAGMVLYVPDDARLTILPGSTLPADWRTDNNFTQHARR